MSPREDEPGRGQRHPVSPQGIHRHEHEHAGEPHRHPHHHHGTGVAHEHRHGVGFERLTYLVSPMHDLDPRAKLAGAALLVGAIVLSGPPRPVEASLIAALVLAAAAIGRLPVGTVLVRSSLVLPFAATIALFAPLAHTGGALTLPGVAGSFAGTGWVAAWTVLSRAWLSALVAVVLAATTPMPRLMQGLRALRVPAVLVMMFSFISRYVGVLRDQLSSLRRALDSRAPTMPRVRRWRVYGGLAGNLLVRANDRGERVHAAMLSRGFDGTLPSAETLSFRMGDALFLLVIALAAAAVALY